MVGKTKKFLISSVVCLGLLCTALFLWLSTYMTQKSTDAINEIGIIYMSEMSNQLQQKFNAITSLRLSQVEGIIKRTPPDSVTYGDEMKEELILSASVRGFFFLGLYAEDGECETLYGEPVEAFDEGELKLMITQKDKLVTSGFAGEERILLLTVNAAYPMKDGKESAVLAAGIPMSELEDEMLLNEDSSLMYSHIIRKDGSFVVRSGDAYRGNYFERIREVFSEYNGKTPAEYEQELGEAMNSGSVYSAMAMVEGTHHHIYCAPLASSEWYLISVMPYGVLDDAVTNLSSQRQNSTLAVCAVILVAMLIVFILYYRQAQQQMRELEEARHEADKANKAKSEFLSNMSHDIRTPMNGIVGMTAIAMTNINDSMRVKDCLRKISLSSKHLLGLINDVLDMSKIESGRLPLNMDFLSLRDTVDNIVNIAQPQIKEKNQHFDIFIGEIEAEEVYCDNVRLNQVLLNLLSNAIKYTPEGGTVNVFLSQEASPLGDSYVRCHFRVRDSGIGMSEEFQKTVFDTFTREEHLVRKIEGTGLGMAITKCIVDAMKGSITVESKLGEGSEFHVTLDLEKAKVSEADMKLPPWEMLVVDNNEDLCRSAVASLKDIGVNAEWALNGHKALEMVKRRHQEHRDYYIILLDWKMPDMDGLETTREIKKIVGNETPILIISAYDWSDIEEEARAAGAQGFISKPLFKSNLYLSLSHYAGGVQEEIQEEKEVQSFEGCRLLVAEDNELNWEIAEEILKEAGFEVEWAEDGQICVEKFGQSAPGYYDGILMDIRMPVMDGYAATKAIRAMDREDVDLPIIAMTAEAFSEDIRRSQEVGMNEHVSKPIDVDRLILLLSRYMKHEEYKRGDD